MSTMMMSRNLLQVLILTTLCILAAGPADKPSAPLPAGSFTEKIPRTLRTFHMIPIPPGQIKLAGAAAAAEIKPFFLGRTELTWDAYDTWAYQLDLSEKDKAA